MWQNRIYALIIRRILGPYLSPKSKRNLQETLDISLRQGTVTLQAIELDGKVLTEKLIKSKSEGVDTAIKSNDDTQLRSKQQSTQSGVSYEISIKKVFIDELTISLFLVYDDDTENEKKQGANSDENTSSSMGAKLVAKVGLNGVHVQAELKSSTPTPSSSCSNNTTRKAVPTGSKKMKQSSMKGDKENNSSSTNSSGFIQSYIQAALDSLKLTLDVNNLTIEVMTPTSTTTKTLSKNTTTSHKSVCLPPYCSWIAIHLNSLSYKDSSLPPPPSATTSQDVQEEDIDAGLMYEEKTTMKSNIILGKEICLHQLYIDVGRGERRGNRRRQGQEIVRFDGYATIIATIMKHISCTSFGKDSMERQLEIALDDKLDVQINPAILMIIRDMLDIGVKEHRKEGSSRTQSTAHAPRDKEKSFSEKMSFKQTNRASLHMDEEDMIDDDDDDDQDLGLLAHILQQQQIESSSYMSSPQKHTIDYANEKKDLFKQSSSLNVEGIFQTNQEGYSHYCKLASSLQVENRDNDPGIDVHTDGNSDSIVSTISFYLKEVLVKIQLGEPTYGEQSSKSVPPIGPRGDHNSKSICLRIADVNSVMTQISTSQSIDLTVDFNDFIIYYEENAHTPLKRNLFQFVESVDPNIDDGKKSQLESTCEDVVMSMKYLSRRLGDTKESDLHLTFSPILVCFYQEVMLLLVDSYKDVTISAKAGDESNLPCNDIDSSSIISKEKKRISIECKLISVETPLVFNTSSHDDSAMCLDDLFRRSGYIFEKDYPIFSPSIVFTVTDIAMNLLKSNVESLEGDLEVQLVLERAILSLLAPSNKVEGQNQFLRFDFLSIDSETQIDPDAIVKIQYSDVPSLRSQPDAFRKQRAKSFFPSIVPLALVKASQQFKDADCHDRDIGSRSGFSNSKRNIRGTDPQSRMLKESSSCEKNLLIQVPNIAVDLSEEEKNILLSMLSKASSSNNLNREDDHPNSTMEEKNMTNKTKMVGVSFRCSQVIASFHQGSSPISNEGNNYLQLIAFDGLHVYCLKSTTELRHIRFITEDITLYEIQHTQKIQNDRIKLFRVTDMCEMLRRRRLDRSNIIQSNAVFFRNKLSHSLSPKTPAVLVDLITKRQEDDYDDVERSLHISLYDLTLRHDLDSCWVDRLKSFCDIQSDKKRTDEDSLNEYDERSTVTNIFCTVSDCNLDYSSPKYFDKSSRTIVRVGELRVTSTLVSPEGPVQTCKLSIGDISVHLSNKRGGYEEENARLSCSNLILQPEIVLLKKKATISHSYDDALFQLDFVAIASLDYLEGIIGIETKNDLHRKPNTILTDTASTADSMLTLSVGKLCIFACKDSFAHFTGTINEFILQLTMPSKDELDVMRKEYFGRVDDAKDAKDEPLNVDTKEHTTSTVGEMSLNEVAAISLNDVMNDGLFSDQGLNESLFSHSPTGDEETLTIFPVQEKIADEIDTDVDNNGSGHEVIHDFYMYDSNHSSPIQLECPSQDGDLTECWTAIDHPWKDDPCIPNGQEQAARWYSCDDSKRDGDGDGDETIPQLKPSSGTVIVEGKIPDGRQPRIFNRHIPLSGVSDPLAGGDMGASTFAGTKEVTVKMRVQVTEMNFLCRLFDGYDWPTTIVTKPKDSNTKSKLMDDLMGDGDSPGLFSDEKTVPQLTEVKQRKSRQSEKYFQFSFSSLKMRMDSFHPSKDHFLSSCLELNLNDMNLIETVSSDKLVKLLGEWVNEDDHPRDSNDGLLMMKMVSLVPETKFAADGKLMGNEGHVVLELLPIRFFIHQIALRFIRQFFRGDDDDADPEINCDNNAYESDREDPPEMFFPTFKVKPFDIKVDYKPLEVDRTALKDGSYIQLLNLLPLEDMILRLNGVELRNLTGWGPVISELACKWLQDVSSTQMHKFLTRTTPLHPLANVGDGMKNFVLIPLKEYKQRGNVKKALRKSTSKLVGVVAYEALSVGAKLTGYAAKKLNKGKKKFLSSSSSSSSSNISSPSSSLMMSQSLSTSTRSSLSSTTSTTSKPISAIPRNMGDVSDRAIESLSRGLKEANAKIIIIPYREYQKTGTKGAMKKVVKGIPVAVCAPLSGAVEALSHGLYGASNSLRPDLFEEREASKRFHDEDL